MPETPHVSDSSRRQGGLKPIREGFWRVDVELPRSPSEPRRRVSRTVEGTRAEAEVVLDELTRSVAGGVLPAARPAKRQGTVKARSRRSGAITQLGHDRWLVGVEGPVDPVTGQRRRYTKTVRGSRDLAEVALARLKLLLENGERPVATSARNVKAACDLYLSETRTESQTIRTDRSACRRICSTVLPGGKVVGEVPLSKLDWKTVEAVYAAWEGALDPMTSSRYASTMSKVLEHTKRTGWISANPCADARRPKVPSHRPTVPSFGDVREALDRAKAVDFMLHAYLMGMATIGCRRSELLAITISDLDLDNAIATIRASIADGGPGRGTYQKTTKRDDWRDVPLTAQMVEIFRELLARRTAQLSAIGPKTLAPSSYVFSDEPAGLAWLRPDSTSQRWLAARGDSDVTFAMLRRYVATQLLDVTSGDYRTVASITGNSEETLRRWYDAGPNLEKKKAVVMMSRL